MVLTTVWEESPTHIYFLINIIYLIVIIIFDENGNNKNSIIIISARTCTFANFVFIPLKLLTSLPFPTFFFLTVQVFSLSPFLSGGVLNNQSQIWQQPNQISTISSISITNFAIQPLPRRKHSWPAFAPPLFKLCYR